MIQNNDTNSEGAVARIPFHGSVLVAQRIDGEPAVAVKPICENIGIDFNSQLKRLKKAPWAAVVMMTTVGADGKNREMVGINRKTLIMWLATIDASRLKNETAKNMVVTYQRECAEALDAYFSDGIAVNRHRLEPGALDAPLVLPHATFDLADVLLRVELVRVTCYLVFVHVSPP